MAESDGYFVMDISSWNQRKTEQFVFWTISMLHARDNTSFNDFLSHLKDPVYFEFEFYGEFKTIKISPKFFFKNSKISYNHDISFESSQCSLQVAHESFIIKVILASNDVFQRCFSKKCPIVSDKFWPRNFSRITLIMMSENLPLLHRSRRIDQIDSIELDSHDIVHLFVTLQTFNRFKKLTTPIPHLNSITKSI